MVSVVPLMQAWTMVKEIPYCVGKMLFTSVSYICMHAADFAKSASKFLRENLTVSKMTSAWMMFRKFLDYYRKLVDQLGPEDVLRHVAHDLVELPPSPGSGWPAAAVWDAELRAMLCGPRMRELLHTLAVDSTDRWAIRFCAERVAAEAAAVAARRDESVADCARCGVVVDAAAFDREFRRIYEVTDWREDEARDHGDGRTAASWYARYGLQAVAADVPGFWCAYREHQSLRENTLDDRLLVDRRGVNGDASSSLRVFEMAATPSGGDLDIATCAKFARAFDPENRDGYRDCRHFAADLAPGVCLLWSASAFSLNVVCFSVQSPRPGAPPSMNVCVYRSSK